MKGLIEWWKRQMTGTLYVPAAGVEALVDDLVGGFRKADDVLVTRDVGGRHGLAPQFLPSGCRVFLCPSDRGYEPTFVLLLADGTWTLLGTFAPGSALRALEWDTAALVAAGLVPQAESAAVRLEAERRSSEAAHAERLRYYREEFPTGKGDLRAEILRLEKSARYAVESYEAAKAALEGVEPAE